MTLRRASNSPRGQGKLLNVQKGNSGPPFNFDLFPLQKECCCTALPATDYVEFKVCPNCSDSLGSNCDCNTNDYDFRTSCTAAPGSYTCTTHGFTGASTCDENDDTGAIYIPVEQLVNEVSSRVLWVKNSTGNSADDTPEYFHTTTPSPLINLDDNGVATSVQAGIWLRFTDGDKRGWMRTTGELRDGDTLTNCQIRGAGIIFNNRDCAGNVWLLGSGNPGFSLDAGSTLNCENVCKFTSWVRLNPCPGECKCNEPDLEDCYHALGEYAAGLWHLPCDSCSVCDPANALGKYVADGDTFDVGKGSFRVIDTDEDNSLLYEKPQNDLYGLSNFQTQPKCPCNYEDAPIQPVTVNGPGTTINCDYDCEGSTKESPFSSCLKATRLSEFDGNGDFICDEDSICTCCCDPGDDYFPNCPTSISITLPGITLSSNSQYPLHPVGVLCVEDQDDPVNSACASPLGSNACDCYPDIASAAIPATIQPSDDAGTCKYESVYSTDAPIYGVAQASVESVNLCEPNFCAGIFGPGTLCSESTTYANEACDPATQFVSGWNGVTIRCGVNSEGISTFIGTARFTVGAFDSSGNPVCNGPSGTVYFEGKNPAGLAQCPADVGPLKIESINANPGSSPIGGPCIDLSQTLPKNVSIS